LIENKCFLPVSIGVILANVMDELLQTMALMELGIWEESGEEVIKNSPLNRDIVTDTSDGYYCLWAGL
jgi:hypothetical protein